MNNNNFWKDIVSLAVFTSLLTWAFTPKQTSTSTKKPRRSGHYRAKYIGSIRLDSWVLEKINSDTDLVMNCFGNFHITPRDGASRTDVTNGITAELPGIRTIVVPAKNIKDISVTGLVYCKYCTGTDPLREGIVKIELGD